MKTIEIIQKEIKDLTGEISNLTLDIEYEKELNVEKGMRTPYDTDYTLNLKNKKERKIIQRDTLRWVNSND